MYLKWLIRTSTATIKLIAGLIMEKSRPRHDRSNFTSLETLIDDQIISYTVAIKISLIPRYP